MTVRELIQQLQQHNPDAMVCIYDQDDHYPIEVVELEVFGVSEVTTSKGFEIVDNIVVLEI